MKFSEIKAKIAEAESLIGDKTSRDFLIPKNQRVPSKEMMEQIPGLKALGPHGEYVFEDHYKAFSFVAKETHSEIMWVSSWSIIHQDNPFFAFKKAIEAKHYYTDFLNKAKSSYAVKGIDWDNPKIYVISCSNTYVIREALKANGAMFNDGFWYFTWPQETYPVIEFDLDKVADFQSGFIVNFDVALIKVTLDNLFKENDMISSSNNYQWFGTEGERVEIKMKVEKTYCKETSFYGFVSRLIGVSGNHRFMMNNNINANEGDNIRIKATIKSHFTNKEGEKITWLSRPKII